jgi:hypothetical protein
MRNKAILFSSLLMASGTALAGESLLEAAAKQLARDVATSTAPEAAQGAVEAERILQQTQQLKGRVENAPQAVKERTLNAAKETARQQLERATPEQVRQGTETVKRLKGQVENMPQSTEQAAEAAKTRAKQKAAEKVLELLR